MDRGAAAYPPAPFGGYSGGVLRIRSDIEPLKPYIPGPGIEEAAVLYGLQDAVKLSSNESPLPPFPEVQEAVAAAAGGVNRYPDLRYTKLTEAMSKALGIPGGCFWFGAGSSALLTNTALALGGPGRSFVYPWPSFGMYRVNTALAGAEPIEVPLDRRQAVDLEAMAAAVRPDTTLVYLCNPNNPTGAYRRQADVREFAAQAPEDTLVLIDEAYIEFVDEEHRSEAVTMALEQPNVVAARTFSKIYGLAGLRIGYAIGRPDTIMSLRKAETPFTVNSAAQAAALAALNFPERVAERREANRRGVEHLQSAFRERGIEHVPTQTNFIWFRLGPDTPGIIQALLERGTIIRLTLGEWTRVTVGAPEENEKFLADLDRVLNGSRRDYP